ncbi:MAG TPA: hypothetical protein VFX61_10800 [Micromonosporaceae bacterium]|nr:hypothetical protein [Micromonosporaceae bacterium]
MSGPGTGTRARAATVGGLLVGALGIAILWAAGVEFPIYPPPGIIILVAGALFVWFTRWRWSPAVGSFFGLFVTVGFLISPGGVPNLMGEEGLAVAVGQAVQQIGVITAFVSGIVATRTACRGRAAEHSVESRS